MKFVYLGRWHMIVHWLALVLQLLVWLQPREKLQWIWEGKKLTSDIEFCSLVSMINAIVHMYTICTHIRLITFIDSEREYVLFCLNLILSRIFQFGIIIEPLKYYRNEYWKKIVFCCYTYHVTFGAGKASQVICKIPFWPRRTLISLNGCEIFSGARKGNQGLSSDSIWFSVFKENGTDCLVRG